MSTPATDPARTCQPKPHIVVSELSNIHYEARLAGEGLTGGPVGTGTDPEMAVTRLCEMEPSAIGLPFEVRQDPALYE